jgi:hypothetical protein
MFAINRECRSMLRLMVFCAAAMTGVAAHAEEVPDSIVPPGAQAVFDATASGVQVYSCEYDDRRQLGWVLKGPSATLYDDSGQALLTHSAGPTWQAADGSRIAGHVLAQVPSDHARSVPRLLLEAKSVGGGGMLAQVRYVQRLETTGGAVPARACTAEHQVGSSPYVARYVFLK